MAASLGDEIEISDTTRTLAAVTVSAMLAGSTPVSREARLFWYAAW